MKKTLQFDYFPVMRSSYVANELVAEGKLQDQLILQWNNSVLFDTIELSKETAKYYNLNNIFSLLMSFFSRGLRLAFAIEKKSISRNAEIVLQKNNNTLVLQNKQSWHDDKQIELTAQIELIYKDVDRWLCKFTYNLSLCDAQSLQSFNDKFGISQEYFHFKLNGETLIHNQNVQAGTTLSAEKEFYWQGVNPIMFEIEEYGHGSSMDSRFIQIVRFTVL